ncbi:hypothetical protein PAAG_11636 [Paracoccidioides lutzii Pb01]|uniref:Uncharacterized protein n=1 Tax=Paracoccidioides lutzii (strain ATCC MYA-826 / Pb01) TaxID=502779 RepID=A0A0A2V1J1_PARBA|nr:hypothetical protein PAAG_11636 [Paracoccidioides lutzii Pb01]KGQ01646.1 hypothetical protein PAAG_11636 [Paracoccidioides lutzii Pb01]
MAKSHEYGDAMSTTTGGSDDHTPLTRTLMEWHVNLGHIHAGQLLHSQKTLHLAFTSKGLKQASSVTVV